MTRKELIKLDEATEMLFKSKESEKAWQAIESKNYSTSYGRATINYARRWAKYMQLLIEDGKSVSEMAELASQEVDIDHISGFMFTYALNFLCAHWKYGDELDAWNRYNINKFDHSIMAKLLTTTVG